MLHGYTDYSPYNYLLTLKDIRLIQVSIIRHLYMILQHYNLQTKSMVIDQKHHYPDHVSTIKLFIIDQCEPDPKHLMLFLICL